MQQVLADFAELVGRVLAKRWMLRQEQAELRSKHKRDRRDGTTQSPPSPQPPGNEPARGDRAEGGEPLQRGFVANTQTASLRPQCCAD